AAASLACGSDEGASSSALQGGQGDEGLDTAQCAIADAVVVDRLHWWHTVGLVGHLVADQRGHGRCPCLLPRNGARHALLEAVHFLAGAGRRATGGIL